MTDFFVAGHALIEREGKYLITLRSKNSEYKPLFWDLPGGVVKAGESIYETIEREVKEETNLDIEIEKVIYVYSNNDQLPVRQTFQIVYLCKYIGGIIQLNLNEHDSYVWFTYSEISRLKTIDFLTNLLREVKTL